MALFAAAFSAPRARTFNPAHWETEHVLSAWLDKGAPSKVGTVPPARPAMWLGPRVAAGLIYDTNDQALPTGIRAVVKEGNRRLLFAADELEVLLRVAPAADLERFELVGQVLQDGVPMAGAPVRLVGAPDHATTDRGGSFRLTDLPAGAQALEIHVGGRIVDIAPLDLK